MSAPLRVRLDETDFRRLVAGEEVRLETIEGARVLLILADIGWERMTLAINDAAVRSRCYYRDDR